MKAQLSPCAAVFAVLIVAALAFVFFIGSTYLQKDSSGWQTPPALCSLSMHLAGSALIIESKRPAEYEIAVNGTLVWPCPECVEQKRLVLPLDWQFAEILVTTPLSTQKFYVARLSNGTYVFAWDGKTDRILCFS